MGIHILRPHTLDLPSEVVQARLSRPNGLLDREVDVVFESHEMVLVFNESHDITRMVIAV